MNLRIGQKVFNWAYKNLNINTVPPDAEAFVSCPKLFYMEDPEFMEMFLDTPATASDGPVRICPVVECSTQLKERQREGGLELELFCPKCGGTKIYWRHEE